MWDPVSLKFPQAAALPGAVSHRGQEAARSRPSLALLHSSWVCFSDAGSVPVKPAVLLGTTASGTGLRAEPKLGAGNLDGVGPLTGPLGVAVPLQVVPSVLGERLGV